MSLLELLVNNPVFAQQTSKVKSQLVSCAISRRYPKEQWITHYGQVWPYLFIVESGTVTALKESSEGRGLIVVSLGAGDVFWGPAFFHENIPTPVALIADEACFLHLWSREDMLPVLLKNGSMSWELARLMVTKMMYASNFVEELAFQPVTGRLARLLLDHFGGAVGDYVARDMTLDVMAARIGTTREMVCRQLYRFSEKGAIRINRTEFMIKDQEMLQSLAGKEKG